MIATLLLFSWKPPIAFSTLRLYFFTVSIPIHAPLHSPVWYSKHSPLESCKPESLGQRLCSRTFFHKKFHASPFVENRIKGCVPRFTRVTAKRKKPLRSS